MYDQVYIQITFGVKCELSLKLKISQVENPNGDNTSSGLCQIHIDATQMNCI